jgi:hypothetical protein
MNEWNLNLAEDEFERLKKTELPENPKYKELSQEIHLPFSYSDYIADPQHQASFIHEYIHLVQASSTTDGIGSFINATNRFVSLFNAVKGQKKLIMPIEKWAEENSKNEDVKLFVELERKNSSQRKLIWGTWIIDVSDLAVPLKGTDLDVVQLTRTIEGKAVTRWHVLREFRGKLVAVPILSLILSEAHAEVMAARFQGVESELLAKTGQETSESHLRYTSIPALINKLLPKFPLAETVHLLCDHALMSFAPDVAFVCGLRYLLNESPPMRIEDWNYTKAEMSRHCGLESNSIKILKNEISIKQKVYSKDKSHLIMNLFLKRFDRALEAIDFRERNPMGFFPWERTVESLSVDHFRIVPAPYVKFSDGVRAMGIVEKSEIDIQAVLSASALFLDMLCGRTSARRPYVDDFMACSFDKTIACSQYPWARGPVGDEILCSMGMLGFILNISDAEIETR